MYVELMSHYLLRPARDRDIPYNVVAESLDPILPHDDRIDLRHRPRISYGKPGHDTTVQAFDLLFGLLRTGHTFLLDNETRYRAFQSFPPPFEDDELPDLPFDTTLIEVTRDGLPEPYMYFHPGLRDPRITLPPDPDLRHVSLLDEINMSGAQREFLRHEGHRFKDCYIDFLDGTVHGISNDDEHVAQELIEQPYTMIRDFDDSRWGGIFMIAINQIVPNRVWDVLMPYNVIDKGPGIYTYRIAAGVRDDDSDNSHADEMMASDMTSWIYYHVVNCVNLITAQNVPKKPLSLPRAVRRDFERRQRQPRKTLMPPIWFVDLDKGGESVDSEGGPKYHLHHRFPVRRHKRHYRNGKVITIHPYVKGPIGAPWLENRAYRKRKFEE